MAHPPGAPAPAPPADDAALSRGISRRMWVMVLAGATVLGLLESIKAFVGMRLQGGSPRWTGVLLGNMPWWLLWVPLMPLVVAVARRYRLDRRPRLLAGCVHVLAAAALSGLHVVVAGTLYYLTHGHASHATLGAQLQNLVNYFLLLEFVTYASIAGSYYAVAYSHRFQAADVAAARLHERAARLEAFAKEAQLGALRSQLHPHFLFNALNAISGLVRRRENDVAVEMIARLGDLLRATLGRASAHEIALHEELALLHDYLEIERIRFRDRLAVELRIQPDTREARVPALVLQPLVENAIRHGIAPTPGPGRVVVSAAARGDMLVLEVENTGGEVASGEPAREGVGLANTRARLAHLYGDAAELRLRPRAGGGAVARVAIPLHSGGDTLSVDLIDGDTDDGATPANHHGG